MPPLDYTTPSIGAIADDVLRQNAIEAERSAFTNEVEVKRLEGLKAIAPEDQIGALDRTIATTQSTATDSRRKADRKRTYTALSDEDIETVRREFLDSWVTSLEREHATHTALLAQRETSLALTGDLELTAAERKSIKANAKTNNDAIKVIESAHALALQLLEQLDA